jgi:integrase
MTRMGRPKTTYADLPAHMTARRSGERTLYYYQAGASKIALGSDKAFALRRWAEIEGQAGSGTTFSLIARHYARVVMPRKSPKTQKDQTAQLKTLIGAFGHLPLQAIRPVHIRQYLDRRSARIAGNREIALLSHLWNWARSQDYTSAPNPCAGIERNFEGKRARYVTDEEVRALRDVAPAYVAAAMDLMLMTAQRPSDVLKARLSDVRDGALWFRQGKTGTAVRISVEGQLASFVSSCAARTPASLFLVADDRGQRVTIWRLEHAFAAARAQIGADWQLRDLRKKATTDEPDLTVASQRAGHAAESTTAEIYRLVKGRKVSPGRGV